MLETNTKEYRLHQHLNEYQVADRLGISVKTLRKMRHERRGVPYIKIGRRVLYSEIDVALWSDENKVSFNSN